MAAFILVKLSDDDSFIIGELHNETEDDVVMKYPVVVRLRTTVNQTTNVTTSKLMPFSENNIVALKKTSIIAFSKPNEKIIKYYLKFMDNFRKILDEDLENDICGIQDEYGDSLDYEDEDEADSVLASTGSTPILH
jgi:hypothetical protein